MAIIPAMTTGMIDFMISSGLITLIAAIPVPLLAVPYAAPSAETNENERSDHALAKWKSAKKAKETAFLTTKNHGRCSTHHAKERHVRWLVF